MADVIKLLPDSIANQIAAGEVIQRPASVVKELVENSVDSGADNIVVNIKDSGKTLVQVIDNGCGMSETDARLCWERHATSKISSANDLFSIQTKGFRGEALASIAAVAEVSLKTRRNEDELGTYIRISGSEVLTNEPVSCTEGSNFSVKNLFYNVPARRKFLKSNSAELRHVINEFCHITLSHPEIEFSLIHNNSQIFNLSKTNLKQRIISILGKSATHSLIPVHAETSMVNIEGYIGKPEYAKKTYGEQFLFINKRYIKHPYFHKAVIQAYDKILPPDTLPAYFIYIETDPSKIDINIHPTKNEIKFEDETSIWQIMNATVKESIGRHNLIPSIDFNNEGIIDIPFLRSDTQIRQPSESIDPSFNPFEIEKTESDFSNRNTINKHRNIFDYLERLYSGTSELDEKRSMAIPLDFNLSNNGTVRLLQLKNRFILTAVKSGLLIIDQKRAHERILYEENLKAEGKSAFSAQQNLFPEIIELNPSDYVTMIDILCELNQLGFDIRDLGNNSVVIHGIPVNVKNSGLKDMVDEMLEVYKSYQGDLKIRAKERIARSVAQASAIPYGKVLEQEEMRELVDQLFGCEHPDYSPSGKPVFKIILIEEIDKILK